MYNKINQCKNLFVIARKEWGHSNEIERKILFWSKTTRYLPTPFWKNIGLFLQAIKAK